MKFIGVFNRDGGTFRMADMQAFVDRATAALAAHGHELDGRIVPGSALIEELKRAADDPSADVVLAGGGDGTISAAAGVCFHAGKPLALLPAGTMNFFARTLRIPLNLDAALEAIADGQFYDVDIATANGRPFVHQFSAGVYARLVRVREGLVYHNRWGKMLASTRALSEAVRKPLRFQVDIVSLAGSEHRLASGIAVSNNVIAEGHMPHADAFDGGVLGVYVAKPMSRFDMLKLFVKVIVGHWKDHPRISENQVTAVTLHFPRRKRTARAVIDGELVPLAARVTLRVHPRALKVFAPKALSQFTSSKEGPAPASERGPKMAL